MAAFPPVLVQLDPDWFDCTYFWKSPENAKTTVDELNDEFGWGCSIDELAWFTLISSSPDTATYLIDDPGFFHEAVTLKPTDETWTCFREIDS
jgi:hypothetical protein